MRAPLSVVIPTLDAADEIGPCLAALVEGTVEGLVREVILADGGSSDGIAAIAEGAGATLVRSAPGRGTQLRAGAEAASGDWLMFLHADTVLEPGWPAAVRRHIERAPDRAGWFHLAFDEPGLPAALVAGWANFRARLLALPYGDQALVLSAALYRKVGGYPDWPLMEDVAIARTLGRRRLAAIPARVVTSAARYRREGWLRRGFRNISTLALHLAGVPPERLARRYRSR